MEPFTTTTEAWAALLAQRNSEGPEALDLVEHAFQTAEGLEAAGYDDEMIAAGLLHDLGDGRVAAEAHAAWAASLVRPLFGERVAWLIAAHADAKRFLCSGDAEYWATLSPVSQCTLVAQGGLVDDRERETFGAHPWASDALALRRCDDAGKDATRRVASPERFRQTLERVGGALRNSAERPSEASDVDHRIA